MTDRPTAAEVRDVIERLRVDVASHEMTGNGTMRRVEAMRLAADMLAALTPQEKADD